MTCLIVGALLTAINHGDQLLRGEFNATMAWQIGLTFLVPFAVATISGAAAIRSRDVGGQGIVDRDEAGALPERPDVAR